MATKKDSADKADEKEAKKTTTKKTPAKKTTKPKAPGKKETSEKPKEETIEVEVVDKNETGYDPKILKPEEVEEKPETADVVDQVVEGISKQMEEGAEASRIIDDSDKILKSSDVELPADEPAGKPKIVVSHGKSTMIAKDDDSIEVINAEEVLKDLEYDFDSHEIKPFKGQAMTSHEMHQGKYGIIDDVTKDKKKK